MQIFVDRDKSADHGTPGRLTVPEVGFACDSLELPWRNNETGKSCILPDTYACGTWFSPHLARMVLRLADKNGRKDCLVHNGNFAGDVDENEETQVHGCTEVGAGYGMLRNEAGALQFGILDSKATLGKLIAAVGPGPHTITYRWKEVCEPADPGDHQLKGV